PGVGRARLGGPPHVLVERADGQVDPHGRAPGRLGEQVEVAQHEGRLGEDRERVGPLDEHLDDAAGEAVPALGPLLRGGVGAHGDEVAPPPPGVELGAQAGDRVDLDDDAALEVAVGVEVEIGVGGAGEAVGAGVRAAPVGVDGVAEPERGALDLVDDPLGPHVQELEAPELAAAGLALEDRLVEERLLRPGLVGQLPPQAGHAATVANVRTRRTGVRFTVYSHPRRRNSTYSPTEAATISARAVTTPWTSPSPGNG